MMTEAYRDPPALNETTSSPAKSFEQYSWQPLNANKRQQIDPSGCAFRAVSAGRKRKDAGPSDHQEDRHEIRQERDSRSIRRDRAIRHPTRQSKVAEKKERLLAQDRGVELQSSNGKPYESNFNSYMPPFLHLSASRSRQIHPKPRKSCTESSESVSSDYTTTTDEESKPPPPTKVYLPRGSERQRAMDNDSTITFDSSVADQTMSSSSQYKRRDYRTQWFQGRNINKKPMQKTLSTHFSTSSTSEDGENDDEENDMNTEQTSSTVEEEVHSISSDKPIVDKPMNGDQQIKQPVAFTVIFITVIQLLILMMQIALCGAASWDINPMIGPYPDAFSLWGGKNPYLMLYENQWWRLITPSFLHVGVIHLLANAFCQLEAIALFEREWGSFKWIVVYFVSSVGCNAVSSYFDEYSIAVGSSGVLMGVYAAKLAELCCVAIFDVNISTDISDRIDQLRTVFCGLTVVSLLSSFTYIDWSGHIGGFLAGFLTGMVLFSYAIRRCCSWFLWSFIGFVGLTSVLTAVIYFFIKESHPYEELADACEYFRVLFPEGYVCGCMWQ